MKFGAHENYCNGPGDCSCGQSYREYADRVVTRQAEYFKQESALKDETVRLKAQVRYWKRKAGFKLIDSAKG